MNTKQWVVGTVAGGIVVFGLGYVLFDLLLADFYAANAGSATGVMREPQVIWAVFVGALAYAALILYTMKSQAAPASVASGRRPAPSSVSCSGPARTSRFSASRTSTI